MLVYVDHYGRFHLFPGIIYMPIYVHHPLHFISPHTQTLGFEIFDQIDLIRVLTLCYQCFNILYYSFYLEYALFMWQLIYAHSMLKMFPLAYYPFWFVTYSLYVENMLTFLIIPLVEACWIMYVLRHPLLIQHKLVHVITFVHKSSFGIDVCYNFSLITLCFVIKFTFH